MSVEKTLPSIPQGHLNNIENVRDKNRNMDFAWYCGSLCWHNRVLWLDLGEWASRYQSPSKCPQISECMWVFEADPQGYRHVAVARSRHRGHHGDFSLVTVLWKLEEFIESKKKLLRSNCVIWYNSLKNLSKVVTKSSANWPSRLVNVKHSTSIISFNEQVGDTDTFPVVLQLGEFAKFPSGFKFAMLNELGVN